MLGIDALVLGHKTFETVLSFDPWPYPGRAVHVMSRSSAVRIPEALGPLVRETSQSPADLLQQLAQTGARRAYLDGGELTGTWPGVVQPSRSRAAFVRKVCGNEAVTRNLGSGSSRPQNVLGGWRLRGTRPG